MQYLAIIEIRNKNRRHTRATTCSKINTHVKYVRMLGVVCCVRVYILCVCVRVVCVCMYVLCVCVSDCV